MLRNLCYLALICLLSFSVVAQDLSKRGDQNPLDCALFLAKVKNDENRNGQELTSLAYYYWQLGRYKDAIEAVELIPGNYNKTNERIHYGAEYLKIGKTEEATILLLRALNNIEVETDLSGNDRKIQTLISSLINLGELQKTIDFAESLIDIEDKAFVLTQISELIADKKGQKEKSLELALMALEVVNKSEWEDIKLFTFLKIADVYTKNGESEKAKQLIEKVTLNYQAIEFSNVRKEDFIEQIIECYLNLKEFDKALNLFQSSMNLDVQDDLYKFAKLNLQAGNKEKADALFVQIEQMQKSEDNYKDSVWSKLIDESIQTNDYVLALDSAKKLNSEYYQLKIVDQFIKQNKKDLAIELLNFVLKKVEKIKTNELETGTMSTSPQMEKAHNLSEIAGKFAEIKQFETALKIINSIEKPYFKAQALADLAVKQKGKNSIQLLNQALLIMQKTDNTILDAKKFIVWSEVAEGFAIIGQKNKALEVFTEILSDEEITDYSLIELIWVGFHFEKSGLKSNEKVRSVLRQIIKDWEEFN